MFKKTRTYSTYRPANHHSPFSNGADIVLFKPHRATTLLSLNESNMDAGMHVAFCSKAGRQEKPPLCVVVWSVAIFLFLNTHYLMINARN